MTIRRIHRLVQIETAIVELRHRANAHAAAGDQAKANRAWLGHMRIVRLRAAFMAAAMTPRQSADYLDASSRAFKIRTRAWRAQARLRAPTVPPSTAFANVEKP